MQRSFQLHVVCFFFSLCFVQVKASMQSTTRKSANDIFEIAFYILTQDFPDPKSKLKLMDIKH